MVVELTKGLCLMEMRIILIWYYRASNVHVAARIVQVLGWNKKLAPCMIGTKSGMAIAVPVVPVVPGLLMGWIYVSFKWRKFPES
jgi:hypothetical protein